MENDILFNNILKYKQSNIRNNTRPADFKWEVSPKDAVLCTFTFEYVWKSLEL